MGNASAKDIHDAVDASDLEKLEKILEAKIELIDALSKEGETPIFRACANGNMDVVELLLEFEADLSITCSSCMDMSCLHMAATDTQPEIVELLLENGADPNALTSDGATPLHCAFQYCAFEIAKLLIRGGADVSMKTADGQTPFEVTPVDSIEVKPFTVAQLQELRSLAATSSLNGNMMVALPVGSGSSGASMSDFSIDFEEMRMFFKQAGLGSMEAKLCAQECLQRGAKTSKKLAASIFMNLFSLQDVLDSVGGNISTTGGIFDDLDYELLNIAITKLTNELYFVGDDGPVNGEGDKLFNVSRNDSGSSVAEQSTNRSPTKN